MKKPVTIAREALANIMAVSEDAEVDQIAFDALKDIKDTDTRTTSPKPTTRKR